jgi:hypothetical protein
MKELKEDWEPFLGLPETFIVSLQSDNILRNLTFKYLAELFKKENAQQKTWIQKIFEPFFFKDYLEVFHSVFFQQNPLALARAKALVTLYHSSNIARKSFKIVSKVHAFPLTLALRGP